MVGRNLVDALHRQNDIELVTPSRNDVDLMDRSATIAYMQQQKPDLVFHLAARVGGIQANMNEPVEFLLENTLMGMHLVEAAQQSGVTRLINLGSSCMYPKDRDILREDDLLSGRLEPTNEGYAVAKISTALLCRYISNQHGLQYKTVIPCNLYGRYDHFDPVRSHMIPAVIRKLHLAKEAGEDSVDIWGDGEARREFMYVGDLVDFLIWSITALDQLPDMLNVGLGFDYSVNDYYRIGAEIVGYQGDFTHDLSKPAGMAKKMMDVTKANALGWRSQVSIEDGMRRTYDYFLTLNDSEI